MLQGHYRCPPCAQVWLMIYHTLDVGGDHWPPRCPDCGTPTTFAPQPGDVVIDAKSDGESPRGFQKFTIHRQVPTRDGLQQVEETIDSVHKLRQIEHDSEQRYKDGEGEPLRFRGYNNDASNRDVNAFGTAGRIGDRTYDSGAQPTKKSNIAVTRHGATKPTVKVARHAGRSPLKG